MLLTATVFAPLAGALLLAILPAPRGVARWVALVTSLVTLGLAVAVATRFQAGAPGFQLGYQADWVPALGVRYRVGVDGVSLPLVLLTTVLTPLAVLGAWRSFERPRGYLALLLLLETAMLGVFVALDLILFYIFWEAVLVPAYFLVGRWGSGERRARAALKLFIYTLAGGLVMLVGILVLYQLQRRTGAATFDYEAFRDLTKAPTTQRWLFLAFSAAFAVKTPIFPFHTWLPDAYTAAPSTTTALLAGAMSKLGVYGFLRFSLPLFPDAARWAQPLLGALAVASILYAALVAIAQADFKRLVAYSSVSHLGFIVLGTFAFNVQGLSGAVLAMVAHGLVIGGLFLLIGMLEERRGTSRILDFGGLQQAVPRMAGVALLVTLGAVALPGLVSFVGEFLALLGAYRSLPLLAALAVIGAILGAVYMLWAYQRMWHGPLEREEDRALRDLTLREWAVLAPLVAAIIVLGFFPAPVLEPAEPAVQQVVQQTSIAATSP